MGRGLTEDNNLDEEVNELWISNNKAFRLFSEQEVRQYLKSIGDEYGTPPRGTNIMFRHVKCPHPISKAQVIDMTDEDINLYYQMLADNERRQPDDKK